MNFTYIESRSHNPYFNLATEQYVFDSLPRDRAYFMLWQNEPSVIIGKFQNAAAEVNLTAAKEAGVHVARRLSGGGAVYHDLGNVNYTIICDADSSDELNMRLFCEPLAKVLGSLGLNAEISGRNDVAIDGAKCSGSAQYVKRGRVMHHGCILFDSDLLMLPKMLNFRPEKYASKGIKSVASRTTKIRPLLQKDMSTKEFMAVLRDGMLSSDRESANEYVFSDDDLARIQKLCDERYSTWEWNIGKSPAYSYKRSAYIEGCGFVEFYFDIEHGMIKDFGSCGDYFAARDQSDLRALLIGAPLIRERIETLLSGVDIGSYYQGLSNNKFVDILFS